MSADLHQDSDVKTKFFYAVKNANASEVVKFFRNNEIKPWIFKEDDEYTGNFKIYESFTSSCFYGLEHYCSNHDR